jgi:hypothetical protein
MNSSSYLSYFITLPFVKPKKKEIPKEGEGGGRNVVSPLEEGDERLRAEVYRTIISRYQDLIEERESRSIAELNSLIKPDHPAISSLRERVIGEFHPYLYNKDFLSAVEKAVGLLNEIKPIQLPVNFWLSFDEILSLKAADDMDKAILLCSLLRALESDNSTVLVTESKQPYVLFEFNGRFHLINVLSGSATEGTREEVLGTLGEDKPLYAFNDKNYEDYREGEA